MRLLCVTSSFPHGPGEAFLIPELMELAKRIDALYVVPTNPRGRVLHTINKYDVGYIIVERLLSSEVMRLFITQIIKSPHVIRNYKNRINNSSAFPIWLKNCAVFPKALWLVQIVKELKIDHIHSYWASTSATIAMIASEILGLSWSFTAHRGDIASNNLLVQKVESAAFCRFISRKSLEMALERGVTHTEKCNVIPLGVDIPEQVPINTNRIARDAFHLICVANLLPVKGHKYLIEAIGHLRLKGIQTKLLIIGDGELRKPLMRQCKELGLQDSIVFMGHLDHANILNMYSEGKIDLFVLPSIQIGRDVHEGIPVSLMEAMSYGIPVVSTWTGGIPELIADGCGVLVKPCDSIALASAIAELINDPQKRIAIGQAGRRRVLGSYSSQLTAHCLIKLINNNY